MSRTLFILMYFLLVQNSNSLKLEVAMQIVVKYGETMETQCKLVDINVDEYTAEDIAWYKNGDVLSEDMYSVVNTTTSLLSLSNVTFDAEGNYSCQLNHLDQVVAIATTDIVVGRSPSIANFSCVCYNMGEMWCTWDPVDSNLPTQYVFTWRSFYYSGNLWNDCPNSITKGPNSCYFDTYTNLGSEHSMRVTSTNQLDTDNKIIAFNPDTQYTPFPPKNLQLESRTAYSILASWTPPIKNSLRYKLQYLSEWETEWSQPTDESLERTNFELFGLRPYTLYKIRVSCRPAYRLGRWSDWSDIISKKTMEAAPTEGVKLYLSREILHDNNKRDVIISWTPPPLIERNGNITMYSINVKPGNLDSIIDANNGEEYTIKGLDSYISYYVSVKAINNAGTSPPSGIYILDKTTAPGKPTITNVTSINEGTIAVSWEEPDNPNGAIINYVLSYAASPTIGGEHQQWHRITFNSSVFYFEVSNLKSFVQYEFKIQAKNNVGFGGNSHTVTEYTMEAEPTGPATNLTLRSIETNPHSLSASWIPPCLDDRNGIIRGYIIKYCPHVKNGNISGQAYPCEDQIIYEAKYTVVNPESLESSASTCHYDITNLRPNTEYAVWVLPFNNKGLGSEATNIVTRKTSEGTPGVPVNLKVQVVTSSELTIMWELPEEPNADITHYNITAIPLNNTNCRTQYLKPRVSPITFQNLCGFETYMVLASACSDSKIPTVSCGRYSSPVYATTTIGVPGPASNVNANTDDGSVIELAWSSPKRPNGPLTGMAYQVSCWNKINTEPVSLVVDSNEANIQVDCDNINEGLPGICTVQAISAEGQDGAIVAAETQPLVCYNTEDWPYVLMTIAVILFLVLLGVLIKLFCIYATKRDINYKVPKIEPVWMEVVDLPNPEDDYNEGAYDIPRDVRSESKMSMNHTANFKWEPVIKTCPAPGDSKSNGKYYVKTCLRDDSGRQSTSNHHGIGSNSNDNEMSDLSHFYDESDEDCEEELDNPLLLSIMGTHATASLTDAPQEKNDMPLSELVSNIQRDSVLFDDHGSADEQRDSILFDEHILADEQGDSVLFDVHSSPVEQRDLFSVLSGADEQKDIDVYDDCSDTEEQGDIVAWIEKSQNLDSPSVDG